MASVRRIPALSTVASAYCAVGCCLTSWQSRIGNPRAECRLLPIKEDECSGMSLAAGGGPSVVSGCNLTWVIIVAVVALLALGVAGVLVREVLAAGQGTQRMQEIARAVQEGAAAYLRRQFRTLGIFVVIIFFVLLLLPADTAEVPLGPEHLLPGRRAVLRADRVHRHDADDPWQRPGGGRGA